MKKCVWWCVSAVSLLLPALSVPQAHAAVKLPKAIDSHMVLNYAPLMGIG